MLYTKRQNLVVFVQNGYVILFAAAGSYFASTLHIPMGWLLGSLVTVATIHFFTNKTKTTAVRISSVWKHAAQVIIALEAGKQVNLALLSSLKNSWPCIIFLLAIYLLTSSLLGCLLAKAIQSDPMTGMFALVPGGVSAIPGIAEEFGAEPAVVSSLQLLRAITVPLVIPVIFSGFHLAEPAVTQPTSLVWIEPLMETHIFEFMEWISFRPGIWTLILFCGGAAGYFVIRAMHLPAALFIGSLLGITFVQFISSAYFGKPLLPWIPEWLNRVSQICLGASLGASFKKLKWPIMKRFIYHGFWGIMLLMLSSLTIAVAAHWLLGIRLHTAILSFAPGGIAVMTAIAISLKEDPTFVIAVQTLRLLFVLLIMPLIIKQLFRKWQHT